MKKRRSRVLNLDALVLRIGMEPASREQMTPKPHHDRFEVELNIPPEMELIRLVVDLGVSLMEIRSYSQSDRDAIKLAVHEMLVNAIRYGSHDNPDARITIRYSFRGDCIHTDIEDEGTGFDMRDIPDPTRPENLLKDTGRGVFLAQQLTHKFQVEKLPRKGFRVSFCRFNTQNDD